VSVGQITADGTVKRCEVVAVSGHGLLHLESTVVRTSIDPLNPGRPERPEDGWQVRKVPLPLLTLPAKPGDTWSVLESDDVRTTYTVGAAERVKVPAGEFVAVPVTRVTKAGTAWSRRWQYWYAPGAGAVKWTYGTEGEVEGEIVMTAFSPGRG
jgi:hypothetical protein